ncbi:nonribosomal peptide synthetase-like protein 2 [Aaosphaeria arxii CBS 175.79]|uniref:Nonribosomal peptide synthetase-like protein 2 n=1 Tax=Aaosphaeria arxii CBS 175.79 TaxID=1450172 RepID=A0A6A5Y353_9PLEO|nr:nonribosomal peptide synthetase-like protein 2 [Aaosphaeria arxii CBS 175.79]KAF2019676.1 nonribosomal peptide synthetase-like protein 2 [Aaosphaeria arxii CBS 175.79]
MLYELDHQLSILNPDPKRINGPELLHDLVPRSAATTNSAIDFLEDGTRRQLSYQSLHALSDTLAHKIKSISARLENASAVVPIFLPQSPELYIALLAVLKAGKAFCPLGLDAPIDRLDFILKDVSANILITSTSYAQKFAHNDSIHVLPIDHELSGFNASTPDNDQCTQGTDLAYVLYTSGSTGLPKAVSVSHRAVTQSLLAHDRHIPAFRRFLQFAAPTFDVSIFEIFFTFYRGCTLVGCSRSRLLDDLPGTMEALEVDAAELTPTVVTNLLQGRKSVPTLKLLLTIGEMLTSKVVDDFAGNDSQESILWGMYGPTEAAIHCTLLPSFDSNFSVNNIGFPLDTVSAFIAAPIAEGDKPTSLTILPIGEIGELVVGGLQTADEYLNRPEITSAAFLNHHKYGHLYRTGDKARILPDGSIECFGRIVSGQVKLRGQRVELGEIERIIAKVNGCHTSAALVISDELVGFCAVRTGSVMKSSVFDTCRQWLPNFMVPSDIIILHNMPQLPSGKIDKRALESIYNENREKSDSSRRSDPTENASPIPKIINQVLHRQISSNGNLSYLGLDSLRAIQVSSLLRQEGFSVGAVDVLSVTTVQDLIDLCQARLNHDGKDHIKCDFGGFGESVLSLPEMKSLGEQIADVIPCTPLQEAMLTETIIRPGAYCNWIELELQESYPVETIVASIQAVARLNEIMRSGFMITSSSSGTFAQIVWEDLDRSQFIQVTDFSRRYTLGSNESLLRPLTIQIQPKLDRPRLLFQIHHALYDGWTFDLLLRDLAEVMNQRQPKPRAQYREVVNYHHNTVQDLSASETYWAQLLKDYQPNSLPNYHGRILGPGRLQTVSLKSSIDHIALSDCADRLATNPQVLYQAAVAYILGSYYNSSDIVFGTVTSGRTLPVTGIEDIMGPCIASLPLRVDLAQCSDVHSILNQIQNANRSMLEHCIMPLRDIVKLSGLYPGHRLFDVLFVWQQSLQTNDISDSKIRTLDSADELEFTLTLEFEPRTDGIFSKATYDVSALPETQVRYMLDQVDDLVNHFLHSIDGKMGAIQECFRPQSLSMANPFPHLETFSHGPAHAVERWASETPDKEALVFGSLNKSAAFDKDVLTYGQLNARANQLARAIQAAGIGKDDLIGVIIDKSIDLYVSILAVLKTGSGYLPLIPDTPLERIRSVLLDASVKVCISEGATAELLRTESSCLILEPSALDLSVHSENNIDIKYVGSHLAYAVFTSGSTGTPKGVQVTQDNLMSNLEVLFTLYPTTPDSRLLQSCSQAFDVSVFEIFFAWYAGMSLCSAKKDDLYRDLEDSINQLHVTHLSLTPTVASLINPNNVPNVKFLVTAGEAVNEHVKRQWAGRGLFQGYGPSETTNICTVRASVRNEDLINNIGAPFSNTSVFVLDPGNEQILPRGAVGELCFGGAQVFRGYMNRPELNAEKIIDLPLYGRIYRSGDMGRLLPDDSILFTGRADDQVKIRGQRVELGEITSIVLDDRNVEDCATQLFNLDNSTQRLVLFWVPVNQSKTSFEILPPDQHLQTLSVILDSLTSKLPSYMVPTHLIPITSIPLTSQTKIDKRSLLAAYKTLSKEYLESITSSSSNTEEPAVFSSQETEIVEALAETLKISQEDVSRDSSFFNLGLDSVSAIQFCRRLRNRSILNVPVSLVLKNPTVARLSAACGTEAVSGPSTSDGLSDKLELIPSDTLSSIRLDLDKRGINAAKILPCTPLQEAMLSSTFGTGESAYSNTMIFKINSDMPKVQKVWTHMFNRHEILRTAFHATDHPQFPFVQLVLDHNETPWDEIQIDQDIDTYSRAVLANLLQSTKPPVKLAMRDNCDIVFVCHHALYDGIAMENLLSEIEKLYSGFELSPPVSYEPYLRHMVHQDLEAADQFWASKLSGLEPAMFPSLTRSIFASPESRSITQQCSIPLQQLLDFSRDSSVSLLPVVQSAWAKILHFYLGEEDLSFGNVASGRSLPEEGLDSLVAPCFNTLPVRVNFDFAQSNADLIQMLHHLNVESSPFQLTPLRRIQSKVGQGQGSLFDTMIILQQHTLQLNDDIWTLKLDSGAMDLPIVLEASQDKETDSLSVTLHFRTSLLASTDATRVLESFDHALKSLVQFPRSAARDTIGFPSDLLAESNLKFKEYDSADHSLLHSAFERNAVEFPNRVALDFRHDDDHHTTWTFEVLNKEANRIAHALVDRNVGPEDIVPILISKSPEYYASILGVMKAGGAFSPIYHDLPIARKQFMLSELKPKVVLCASSKSLDWCSNISLLDVTHVQEYPDHNPSVALKPTNLAYCLYTSGSTGLPKAVSMEHRAPMQTIESSRRLIPWNHDSRLLQYAAVSFDMCYYDCFLAWTFGFTLCAAEQNAMLNDLTGIINSLAVDLLDLTPSVAGSISRAKIPSVKWLYCIGEAMTADVVQKWGDDCVNSYGPTEAAFCTTIMPVSKDTKTAIFGKPFPSTAFAVFSKNGDRTLPVFGEGELYIGGTQLARGYYGNPQLTEERFVQRNGLRFYRSGDIVRMLADGNFEFLGRADDQVKIRGQRVELGEISHVLQGCDERINSVSAQIMKIDDSSKDQLVAFISTTAQLGPTERSDLQHAIKRVAKANLPSYMVPQFLIIIDSLPKSAAGKVDKHALKRIFIESEDVKQSAGKESEAHKTHQWTNVESIVREIFAKLANVHPEDIGPDTSIYQLGLDSISAVQVATALRKRGLKVNATDVLKYMNCVDLGAYIDESPIRTTPEPESFDFVAFENKHRDALSAKYDSTGSVIEKTHPCTPLQQGMLSQFITKEGAVYLNHIQLRLSEGVDIHKLKSAWQSIVDKHVILRTGFAQVKDTQNSFAMIHYNPGAFAVPWEETSKSPKSIDEWLKVLQGEVLSSLHQPPWRMRITSEIDVAQLDIALFHVLFDAQSLQLILNDVAAAYNGLEIPAPLSIEPVINSIIQQSRTAGNSSTEFWKGMASKMVPTKFPNLAPLRYNLAAPVVLAKPASIPLAELEAGCRVSNTTLQAAGIASWTSLLSAYTGEPSVTCGVVLSGRNFEDADSVVFPCITTIPFAVTLQDDKKQVLQDVNELNANIQMHQFTPLNDIQRLVGYPNEALFDTLFAFQKIQHGEGQNCPWEVIDENATSEYPISIELEPKNDKLELRLTFLPHMVPQEQAALILEQLDHLLIDFILPGIQSTSSISKDRSLYSDTPPQDPTLPSDIKLLHEFVEASAVKYPQKIAFEFATSISDGTYTSRTWTYEQLDSEGNRIADLLISRGILPGGLVGVCFDKCPEASIAMLGILKAGCAFVALDPGAPSARRAFIVEDASLPIVLSMKAQSHDLPDTIQPQVLNLDTLDLSPFSVHKPVLQRLINPQDRSYCLYTSGTTGTPKGCELTHENAVQAMLAFEHLFSGHWDQDSRWLQFASFHFDVSVLEQYWSWYVGIRVVSAPRDVIFEDLAGTIKTLEITHIDLTPSLARILHPDDVPSLCRGVFITGGESLKQEILDVWGPKGVIYNGYGPTEATIGVTMYPRVPSNGKPSNIGPQFLNVGSLVLKPGTDIPVLRGAVGELCVSGKLVGKGYLNRPELTEERFPYIESLKERVYRTGDLVRILHDGTFDFLGRADDQVKLRGQRLEIGEINSVIKQASNAVSDVATLVLKHPKQQKEQLVSFVVNTTRSKGKPKVLLDKTTEMDTLKEACLEKLPGYMVPTHFIALSAMALSANNKADNRTLREMYYALSLSDLQLLSGSPSGKEEKWSPAELRIRDVLKDVLQVKADDIGRSANIFELGLDSISVIGLSSALKQAGFKHAAASTIMKNTSISRLSKALVEDAPSSEDLGSVVSAQQLITATQHRHRRGVAEVIRVDAREISALAPCTPLQQGMIARSLESENGLYFNTFRFNLAQSVNLEKLQTAWEEVFYETQILRTVFCNTDDGFVQAVVEHAELSWNVHTSTEESLKSQVEELRKSWWQHNRTVIDRPFELHLISTPSKKVLVVHIFHALYDGIAIDLLFRAVWDAYNGRLSKSTGPAFQSALPHGPLRSRAGAKEFWLGHLSNSRYTAIPSMAISPTVEPTTVARDLDDLAAYETVRRELGVTHQAIAQACWATVLQRHTNMPISLGMVVSGRSIDFEGAERIIGPLFNTIPYQHRLESQQTWRSIIKRTHEFNVATHSYQHTPLRDIMKWLKRSPDQPLFETLFVYQISVDDQEWSNNDAWGLEDGDADADYPLAIEVEQHGNDRLRVTLVANGHVADKQASKTLLDEFEAAMRELLKDHAALVTTSFGSLSPEERVGTQKTDPDLPKTEFTWSDNAKKIRQEIASLSSVEIQDINEQTSIFELGLDSIDAIKLSSKLKKCGIELPVSAIMRSLTIKNMVDKIPNSKIKQQPPPSNMVFNSHKRRLEDYARHNLASTDDIERILPLTPLQEGMVAEMIASEYKHYYNHDVLRLQPDVDIDSLQKAFTKVVDMSPILRTSFIEIDDPNIDFSFAQVIQRTRFEVKTLDIGDAQPNFPEIFDTIRKATINKAGAPPFHVHMLQGPSDRYLVLSIAHAMYDGWSLGLLHTDIRRAYEKHPKSRPDYENTLRKMLTASGADAVAFWRDFLSGSQPTSFKRPTDTNQASSVVIRKEKVSDMTASLISTFAKRNNITLQTLGQTAYAFALASYVQSLDVTFGSVLSGRDDDRSAELLFPTMNTVAIRTILHGTRLEMLQYMQENFAQIQQYQHFPLRKVQALAKAQGRLFDNLFIYQKRLNDSNGTEKILYESVEGHSDVEYPVCVEMEVFDGQLIWRCAIEEEALNQDGVEELLKNLDAVLRRIIEEPQAPAIEFTSSGTSVCGLPHFNDKTMQQEENNVRSGSVETDSATATTIRKVLALVSKTPEEEITAEMTIFHIGLDSISAIKVSSLLRKQSIILSVGEMLKAGTIENMARLVDERSSTPEEDKANSDAIISDFLKDVPINGLLEGAGLDIKNIEQVLPATAGQMFTMMMWLNSKGTNFYPDFSYKIFGSISFEALSKAWQATVDDNPILRTALLATNTSHAPFTQAVLQEHQAYIIDLTNLDEDQTTAVSGRVKQNQPFAHLFVRLSPTGWDLKLAIHHALYDGVSLPSLVQQLQDRCNSLPSTPPSVDGFKNLIAEGCSPTSVETRKGFWTQYLRGIEKHQLHQPSSTPTSKTEIFTPRLINSIQSIESISRRHGISTQSLFLALYARLYARMLQAPATTDIVIGIYLANRSHSSIADISTSPIPTVNIVPLRINAPLTTETLASAAQIQHDVQEISSAANSSVSLWEIKEWAGVTVDTFVNFLKLPEASGGDKDSLDADKIAITQTQQWDESVTRIVETPHDEFETPATLSVGEDVRGVYLHGIDVEATIRKQALDVGVFAPESMMGLVDGEALMRDLKRELEALAE